MEALRLFEPADVHEEKMNKNKSNRENDQGDSSIIDGGVILEIANMEDSEDDDDYNGNILQEPEENKEDQTGEQEQEEAGWNQEVTKEGKLQLNLQDALDKTMQALERNGLISPLEIIEAVVESCGDGKWGMIREFFERYCSSLRRDAMTSEHSSSMWKPHSRTTHHCTRHSKQNDGTQYLL